MIARLSMTERQAREWLNCEPMLRRILFHALSIWPVEQLMVTCIYRTHEEEERAGGQSGIHKTPDNARHRAIDLRTWNLAEPGMSMQERADEVADALNAKYTYDPDRPTLMVAVSKVHGSGPHIHLQSHRKTAPA